ncbi:hypothetical protein I6F13_30130 [Bradyrhizobium sp. IC4061]|nr:hypothetical protein [Bradyrhizobium sp. IC4061]
MAVEAVGIRSGDDGIMPLFCPTEKAVFVKSAKIAAKSLKSLSPATVHGVVFDLSVFPATLPVQISASVRRDRL